MLPTRRKRRLAGLTLLALLGGCAQQQAEAPKSGPPVPRTIHALGKLEPAGGVISVSAMPGERLVAYDIDVREGYPAPSDGVLGEFESLATRRRQLEALRTKRKVALQQQELDVMVAQTRLDQAVAALEQAKAQQREATLQEPRLEVLREAASIATADLQRLRELASTDPDLVTPHQLRRRTNLADQGEADYLVAEESFRSGLTATEAAVRAAEAGRRAAEAALQRARDLPVTEAIEAEIAIAEHALRRSYLWAPGAESGPAAAAPNKELPSLSVGGATGRYSVLRMRLKPGEYVGQLPVVQLADLGQMVCVAEVHQADVRELALGRGATIISPAFGEEFRSGLRGKIVSIGRLVGSAGITPLDPLAPLDRSVVQVRIAIDPDRYPEDSTIPPETKEAARLIGLEVDVEFDAAEAAPAATLSDPPSTVP